MSAADGAILFELSARAQGVLRRQQISTLKQLSQLTEDEMRDIRQVGPITFDELTALLHRCGLGWRRPDGAEPRIYRESDMRAAFEFGLGLYADGDGDGYFPEWLDEHRQTV